MTLVMGYSPSQPHHPHELHQPHPFHLHLLHSRCQDWVVVDHSVGLLAHIDLLQDGLLDTTLFHQHVAAVLCKSIIIMHHLCLGPIPDILHYITIIISNVSKKTLL